MSDRRPTDTAIQRVIKAFGNAPISGTADAFGNTKGITLHVIVSDPFSPSSSYKVWTGSTPSFSGTKVSLFGTVSERTNSPVNVMPGMTPTGWTNTGKTLKHYVYHYGQWINYWGGSCVDGSDSDTLVDGLSSGIAELLGNDFVVSLGCGFGGGVVSGGSSATRLGSLGTDDEQAGTFMHEVGHNLNLGHGGVSTAQLGVRTSTDYTMNCKLNYLSVMNYARQIPNAAFPASTWEANFNYNTGAKQTALDYARSTLPNIDEKLSGRRYGYDQQG